MSESISVIIPSYNTSKEYLTKLYNSLIKQFHSEFEVIIVDDCSTFNYYKDIIKDNRFKVIYKDVNSGPAESRNIGVEHSSYEYLFFTDSDCEVGENTLSLISKYLEKEDIIMGNTITKTKTYFGKSVALLGFPGGGILGFDRVWRVINGYTDSISSCNLAVKKKVFQDVGKFDTSFPVPGGEDTVFAKNAIKVNHKIKYLSDQLVYHVERPDLKGFIKWQITRGRGNYYIKKKLGKVGSFFKLRLWSIKNSICSAKLKYVVLVSLLWILSVYYQTKGYLIEKNLKLKNRKQFEDKN